MEKNEKEEKDYERQHQWQKDVGVTQGVRRLKMLVPGVEKLRKGVPGSKKLRSRVSRAKGPRERVPELGRLRREALRARRPAFWSSLVSLLLLASWSLSISWSVY